MSPIATDLDRPREVVRHGLSVVVPVVVIDSSSVTLPVVKKQRFFEGTVWHFYWSIKFQRLMFSYVT